MKFFYEDDDLSLVKVHTDKPMFEKTEFVSEDQGEYSVALKNGIKQLLIYYKLSKPPHGWYFVLAANLEEDKKYVGVVLKVSSKAKVSKFKKKGIDIKKPPTDWTKMGEVTVEEF